MLRDYQVRSIERCAIGLGQSRSVCLVAPTGSGKTVMGNEIAKLYNKACLITHSREIADQTPNLETYTIQSILAKPERFSPTPLVILDECHHLASDKWRNIFDLIPPESHILGLTATPQRHDGRPLGEFFNELVIAESYSKLVNDGYIAHCRVFRPGVQLGGLAMDPLSAYKRLTPGQQGFVYCHTVRAAESLSNKFTRTGIAARCVSEKTPDAERKESLAAFRQGLVKVLCNVYTLTEGVDVPEASVCILARGCSHVGPYLQMVGRVLRPHPIKDVATLIDLSGASHEFGLPTDDREYSLGGNGISRGSGKSVHVCPQCGCCVESFVRTCPECGYVWEVNQRKIRIYSSELAEVYDGGDTPRNAKLDEWRRLAILCRNKGWSLSWAAKQFAELFPGDSVNRFASHNDKTYEFVKLRMLARGKGYKPGWASHRYRQTFGVWPKGVG